MGCSRTHLSCWAQCEQSGRMCSCKSCTKSGACTANCVPRAVSSAAQMSRVGTLNFSGLFTSLHSHGTQPAGQRAGIKTGALDGGISCLDKKQKLPEALLLLHPACPRCPICFPQSTTCLLACNARPVSSNVDHIQGCIQLKRQQWVSSSIDEQD